MYSFTDNNLRFYKYRTYFELEEVINYLKTDEQNIENMKFGLPSDFTTKGEFLSVVELLSLTEFTETELAASHMTSTTASQLMRDYIYPNHWDDVIFYVDSNKAELDGPIAANDDFLYAAYKWASKLVAVLNNTWDLYYDRLTYYTALKDGLTAAAEHVTVSTYKDLPQDSAVEPELPNDVRRTEETRGIENKAMRLKEINEAIRAIMYEWAQEFDDLFIATAGDGKEIYY